MDDFKAVTDTFVSFRQKKLALDDELSLINAEMAEVEKKLLLMMEELNMEKFSIPDIGTIYTTQRFYARTPKTPEAKEAFFNYLKANDEFDALISVNANTMNAWYKSKMEDAASRGELLEVPGITEIGLLKSLTLRKG